MEPHSANHVGHLHDWLLKIIAIWKFFTETVKVIFRWSSNFSSTIHHWLEAYDWLVHPLFILRTHKQGITEKQLIGAVSAVWLVSCAQLTPEEQLLGNGEPLGDQFCSEQVTGVAGRMDLSEWETPEQPKHIQKHRGHGNCPHIKTLARLDTKAWTRWAVKSHLKTRLYGIFTQSFHFEEKKHANEVGGANRGVVPCRWFADFRGGDAPDSERTDVAQDRWSQFYRAAVRLLKNDTFYCCVFEKDRRSAVHF